MPDKSLETLDITQTVTDQTQNAQNTLHVVEEGNVEAFVSAMGSVADAQLYDKIPNLTAGTTLPFQGQGNDEYTGYISIIPPLTGYTRHSPYAYAGLVDSFGDFPDPHVQLGETPEKFDRDACILGWMLGHYAFSLNPAQEKPPHSLHVKRHSNLDNLISEAHAVQNLRDWVNLPANILGPEALGEACLDLAKQYNASASEIILATEENFPLLYNVGKAAIERPRLFDATFECEEDNAPNILILGKGITYDSGGLALKDHLGMTVMHKDMGGAAHAMALTQMLLDRNLPINIRLVIPIAENTTSENSLRNGDIIQARNGQYVKVMNTDAEGRLVLADAFAYAAESNNFKPDMMIDFATLTGAARISSYKHHPAVFTSDYKSGQDMWTAGSPIGDPIHAIPIIPQELPSVRQNGYLLNSLEAAHPQHIGATSFLREFAKTVHNKEGMPSKWVHVDTCAWQYDKDVAGRPPEGSDRGMRAIAHTLINQYG